MLVRHAKVHDPYDVQNLVVYQEDDVMQHFLTALIETSSIPPLSDCDIYHGESLLNPASRFLDCTLPNNPTLHVCFSGGSHVPPAGGPGNFDSPGDAEDTKDGPGPPLANIALPTDNSSDSQTEPLQIDNTGGIVQWLSCQAPIKS